MSRAAAHADPFLAVSDATRRGLLDLLEKGERTVTELVAAFELTQPAISKHLRVLREAGLVTFRKEGRSHVYALDPEPLRTVAEWVAHYERFWNEKLVSLGRYLDEEAS